MKPFPTKAFVVVVVLQVLLLAGMIGKRMWLLQTGKTIRLECEPVDPRSLLSGDYVVLNYKIARAMEHFQHTKFLSRVTSRPSSQPTTLSSSRPKTLRRRQARRRRFVRENAAPAKEVLNLDKSFPKRRPYTIYIGLEKAPGSKYWHAAAVSRDLQKLKKRYAVVIRGQKRTYRRIRFGVEHYFVPQYEGKMIEKQIRDVSVEVVVSASGESAIRRIFIRGKEVKFY